MFKIRLPAIEFCHFAELIEKDDGRNHHCSLRPYSRRQTHSRRWRSQTCRWRKCFGDCASRRQTWGESTRQRKSEHFLLTSHFLRREFEFLRWDRSAGRLTGAKMRREFFLFLRNFCRFSCLPPISRKFLTLWWTRQGDILKIEEKIDKVIAKKVSSWIILQAFKYFDF